jgi:signal transduction histidine kinase
VLPESILDRDAILQVLLNLLDNAVKYAGDNGAKIRVGVRPGGPGGAAAGRGVVIEVEDDGPGVPEKERELVFEEFYRGDDTLSRRVEGTGIGLAVARRIVLAHGGRIDVTRSERLGGAWFAVALPDAETGRRLALAASRGHTS